jgi:hypothetical protein
MAKGRDLQNKKGTTISRMQSVVLEPKSIKGTDQRCQQGTVKIVGFGLKN